MDTNVGMLVGFGLGIILFVFLFVIAIYVINGLGLYKIFKKAGNKGWAGFVPYYSDWILVEISGCHWWYYLIILGNALLSLFINTDSTSLVTLLSGLLSLISLYVLLCINYNIAKKFHREAGFAIGMTFIPIVFYLILGFSNECKYDSSVEVSPWGLYDFNKKNGKNNKSYCSNCGTEMSGNFCPKCGTNKRGE